MTPIEKSWVILCELNNAFISKSDLENSTEYAKKELKRKAIYLVDEILKSRPSLPKEPIGGSINVGECVNLSNKYWYEVKQYIESL